MMTSCGIIFLGSWYSVITTRVPLPLTRGSVCSVYGAAAGPRLTVARNAASRSIFGPKSRIGSRATSRTCGRSTWLLFA